MTTMLMLETAEANLAYDRPSHHGGFLGGEFGYPGQPEAFARRLREVLAEEKLA